MSPIRMPDGSTYDPFPDGHYIHPFHNQTWDYSDDDGKEAPRTVRSPFVPLRFLKLTEGRRWLLGRRNADVCSLERNSRKTQLVGEDQGSRPRREMDAGSVGSTGGRIPDSAAHEGNGKYT